MVVVKRAQLPRETRKCFNQERMSARVRAGGRDRVEVRAGAGFIV